MDSKKVQEFKDKWAAMRGRTVIISVERDGKNSMCVPAFNLIQMIPGIIDYIDEQNALLARMDEAFIKLYIESIPGLMDAEGHARRCLEQYKQTSLQAIRGKK